MDRRYQEIKARFLTPCWICGGEAKEAHHLHPEEKSELLKKGSVWKMREDLRIRELQKCVPLCRGCHKYMHAPEHGTRSMYGYRGCRCDACKKAHAEYHKEYREKRKKVAVSG